MGIWEEYLKQAEKTYGSKAQAYKYWEPETGSLFEHFLKVQQPDGMIFDYVCSAGWATDKMKSWAPGTTGSMRRRPYGTTGSPRKRMWSTS